MICKNCKKLKIFNKTYPYCDINKAHVPWKVLKNKWVSDYCPLEEEYSKQDIEDEQERQMANDTDNIFRLKKVSCLDD
jgi:hypothetical protein